MTATIEELLDPKERVGELYLLIDGDIYAHRAAAVTDGKQYYVGQSSFKYKKDADAFGKALDPPVIPVVKYDPEPFRNCSATLKGLMLSIDNALRYKAERVMSKVYLSCSGSDNYRSNILPYYKWTRLGIPEVLRRLDGDEELARSIFRMTPATFEKNREIVPRIPQHLSKAKDYLRKNYKGISKVPFEADDLIGMEAMRLRSLGKAYIIVTIDKDLNCIPGVHYDSVQDKLFDVSEEEALCNFYKQCLTGDDTDAIPGIKGIGPATAEKIISSVQEKSHESLYGRVLEEWVQRHPGTAEEAEESLRSSAQCLWILQDWQSTNVEDKVWKPPVITNDQSLVE